MKDFCSKEVRLLLLAPADDGAVLLVGQGLVLLGQTGQGGVPVHRHGLRQLQQRHVIVHGVPVVGRMDDGPLHNVFLLRALVHDQVVLTHPHDEVLAHTVAGGQDPARVDQGPTAEGLAVLVEDDNLPGPPSAVSLTPANNFEGPGDIAGLGRDIGRVTDPTLPAVVLDVDVLKLVAQTVELALFVDEREALLVCNVEGLAGLVPGLTLALLLVAVGLLRHLVVATHHGEPAGLQPRRLAEVGARGPPRPLGVERTVPLQLILGLASQLLLSHDMKVAATAAVAVAAAGHLDDGVTADGGHGTAPLPPLLTLPRAPAPPRPVGVDRVDLHLVAVAGGGEVELGVAGRGPPAASLDQLTVGH